MGETGGGESEAEKGREREKRDTGRVRKGDRGRERKREGDLESEKKIEGG